MHDEIDKMYERINELEDLMEERLVTKCTHLIEYLDEDEQEEYNRLQSKLGKMEKFELRYLAGLENITNKIHSIGHDLIKGVKKKQIEYEYMVVMRELYDKIFRIIEDEFDMEIG